MSVKARLFLTAVLAVVPLHAREKSDVIIMKNGDKITCEVKNLSSNTLYISVDYVLNTVAVDWTKVDHIESKQTFRVKTEDGEVHTGTLSTPKTPAQQPVEIEVLEDLDSGPITLERRRVVTVYQTSSNFWHRWNGQLGSGSSYTKGNQSAQYNINSGIGYGEERWSAGAIYSSNLSSSSGSGVSTRNQLSLQVQRLLRSNNWYLAGLVSFLQSSVQGIQLQDTFGGGIGRTIASRGSVFFTTYAGFAWQDISYHEAILQAPTQHVTMGLLGTQLKLFRFDRTNLAVSANLLPAISDPGRVQFNLNASYYVKLWGQLNWNVTFYGNWDNRPPPGFAHSDYGTSSGLSISFGNPLLQ